MLFRTLRAFGWLRWRILLNAFAHHGARDAVERFSLAFDQLAPTFILLLMVPSALTLAAAGVYAGWLLANQEPRVLTFEFLRFVLLGGTAFAIIGPIVLPIADRTNVVRLLLLPISNRILYLAQSISASADPWMLLIGGVILSIPVGLAAGGAWTAALLAAAAGLALMVLLAGLTLAVTSLVQLTVRNRRRGEIITLIFIVVIPMIGILPGVLADNSRSRDRSAVGERRAERSPGWVRAEQIVVAVVPSEIYIRTTRGAARGENAAAGLAALLAGAAALHGLAFAAFTRMLATPMSVGRASAHTRWGLRLPGIASATSAVALAQFKLGLRTPRGRSTVLSPIALFLVFAVVMLRGQSGATLGFISVETGVGLASFTTFVGLLSVVPLAFNQFAIDKTGLTLTLLAPVDTRSLLAGKAIGLALIAAIPVAFCFVGSAVLFPKGEIALWVSVALTLVSTYLLVAPAAAVLSSIFPKTVDMNSLGRSNAHGTAGFLGTIIFLLAGAPGLFLVLASTRLLQQPSLAPLFLLLWTALCAGLSLVLFRAAADLFERRRENLVLLR